MNKLISVGIEFVQATAFVTLVGFFLLTISGASDYRATQNMYSFSIIFGGGVAMLAKRFILSFIKEVKAN